MESPTDRSRPPFESTPASAATLLGRMKLREIRPDDLFIVSYPKSGNTWVRFLLANLLHPGEEITFRNIERFVPDLYKSTEPVNNWSGRRLIKVHHPYYGIFPKFICIYRDPRDALVSYFHFSLEKKVFQGDFHAFLRSDFPTRFTSWPAHVLAAMEEARRRPEAALVLRYEAMLKDPHDAASLIARFAGVAASDELLSRAVRNTSFDKLRNMEQTHGPELLHKRATFFRKGTSGQWREYFTGDDYDQLLATHGSAMQSLGYAL